MGIATIIPSFQPCCTLAYQSWVLLHLWNNFRIDTILFIFISFQYSAQYLAHRTTYSRNILERKYIRREINSSRPPNGCSLIIYMLNKFCDSVIFLYALFYIVIAFFLLFFLLSRGIWSKISRITSKYLALWQKNISIPFRWQPL